MKNKEVCKLLILRNGDKIKGRSLVWTLKNGDRYMDRIYTADDSDTNLFESWAHSNEIVKRYSNGDSDDRLEVILGGAEYSEYPYMDSLSHYNVAEGKLYSGDDIEYGDDYLLRETDGSYTGTGSNCVWSDYHNENIQEDSARWCEDVNSYVHVDNCFYLEYKDYHVSDRSDVKWSDRFSGYYLSRDVLYSEMLDDYLCKDSKYYTVTNTLVEVRTGSDKGDIDYGLSNDVNLIIKVDDKYYLRENYIKYPYTGKYIYTTDDIDGQYYSTYLITKIRNDLNVDSLKKVREELSDMLVECEFPKSFLEKFKEELTEIHDLDLKINIIARPVVYSWVVRENNANYFNVNFVEKTKYFLDKLDTPSENKERYYLRNCTIYRRDMFKKLLMTLDYSEFDNDIYKRIVLLNLELL